MHSLGTDVPTLVALLVCLIPTTIGALLAAIGIAGMDRALRANIIAKSGKAVEVAGDVDTLLLDKTGTITVGNRRATHFIPFGELHGRRSGPPCVAGLRPPMKRPKARASSICSQLSGSRRRRAAVRGNGRPLAVARGRAVHPIHRPNAHERHRPARRPADSQGIARRDHRHVQQQNGAVPAAVEGTVATWPARAPRRCWSARATASPAWSCWKTSSSRASASASSGCAAWASAP